MDEILEEIYHLTKKKMLEQGGFGRAAFKQYVEETIQYFREKGKLTDDDSDEFLLNQLLELWNERAVEDDIEKHNV